MRCSSHHAEDLVMLNPLVNAILRTMAAPAAPILSQAAGCLIRGASATLHVVGVTRVES
jgi:hypothetical protein